MYETLVRPHQVDILPSLPSIRTALATLPQSEVRREAKRLRQIANSRSSKVGKRNREEDAEKAEESEVIKKRAKTDEAEGASGTIPLAGTEAPQTVHGAEPVAVDPSAPISKPSGDTTQNDGLSSKISVSKAFPEVRGHTSYLTFAILLPAVVHGTPTPEEAIVQRSSTISTGKNKE